MRIIFDEQDLADSVCVWMAAIGYASEPECATAELRRSADGEIYAIADGNLTARGIYVTDDDIVDGITIYLEDFYNFDPELLTIELYFDEDEGFGADIITTT
jgi:hypothetical protein